MNFFQATYNRFFGKEKPVSSSSVVAYDKEVNANYELYKFTPIFYVNYDGEKTPGEIGALNKYVINHWLLSNRAWQAFMDSDIVKSLIKKYVRWIIASGLKLNVEPDTFIIGRPSFDQNQFIRMCERRFKLYTHSRTSDYKHETNLHKIAKEAYKHAKVGGDVLVVLRVIKGNVNVQLYDGELVRTPVGKLLKEATNRGNKVINGIEIDSNGKHVAYFVKINAEYKRIVAKGSRTGRRYAYLVYGDKYRIKNQRGIPLITTILEKVAKLDRYSEAVVGTAEEIAKVVYTVVHDVEGSGENPLEKNIADNMGVGAGLQEMSNDKYHTSQNIARTTQKQVFNLAPGSRIESVAGKGELNFKEFYPVMFQFICATLDMPPDVGLAMYNSSFSASRAALRDWQIVMDVEREDFADQFYKPFYNLWLENEILNNRIDAPGYFGARRLGDPTLLEAYQNCRFTGISVPHIDPVKEVEAIRKALGTKADNVPLTTFSQATEALNGGDFSANMQAVEEQREEIPEDLRTAEKQPQTPQAPEPTE